MLNQNSGFIILMVILGLIVLIFIRRHFKRINVPNVFLVSGAVKSGKTLLSVHLAIKEYKKALLRYRIRKFLLSLIGMAKEEEKPMLYTNLPIAKVHYNILTIDIILGNVRIPRKSVVLIDEASLLADSMFFNNKLVNNSLMKFIKLYAHLTCGGKLILDTQAISDLHFSFKRCINSYLYIYERTKLPFITIMKVREMMSIDDHTINNFGEDIELSMRKVIIFNSTYKKYDCYSYSTFFDYLPTQVKYDTHMKGVKDNLKVYQLVTFHDFGKELNEVMRKQYPLTEEGEIIEVDDDEEE